MDADAPADALAAEDAAPPSEPALSHDGSRAADVVAAAADDTGMVRVETATAEPATAPAPATSLAPPAAAEPFDLPVDDLRALAASAGLEWVNSNAERILVVQQAMASEPKPVHVPRQPRPPKVLDDGPLILVASCSQTLTP